MKYKVLKSIAHNFSHSFVGYTELTLMMGML